jgi:hypothetical protein
MQQGVQRAVQKVKSADMNEGMWPSMQKPMHTRMHERMQPCTGRLAD